MKHFLDQDKIIAQLDPGHVYESVTRLDAQLNSAWQEIEMQTIKHAPKNVNKICVSGMGGSALAARIIKSLTPLICNLPFEITNNYRLPNWVDKNTLVILKKSFLLLWMLWPKKLKFLLLPRVENLPT